MLCVRLVIFLLMLLVSVTGFAAGDEAVAPAADSIAAMVGGVAIHNSEVEAAIDSYVPPGGFHGGISAEKRGEFRPKALDLLIEKELLYQEALKKEYKATEEEIDSIIEANVKRFPSKKAFEKEVKTRGLDSEKLRHLVAREILINKIFSDEIAKKSVYSAEELKAYYETHIDKFKRPETMRLWHILVKVDPSGTLEEKAARKERAGEVHVKAIKGDDFLLLAEQYSDDPYRVKGGDLGYIHKGRLDADLEAVAFELKEGEISPVVETIYGFHVMKAGDRKPPETIPFEETKNKLKSELETKRFEEKRRSFTASLKERTKVEVY